MGFQTVIFNLCRNKEILDSLAGPEHHLQETSGAGRGRARTRLGALALCTLAIVKAKELQSHRGKH